MKKFTPLAEIEAHRHPILSNSHDYEIARCVYDFDTEHNQNTITLTMVNRHNGERRCLQFSGVICDHPLKNSLGIYILDASYRQLERVRVEVGEYFEESRIHFLANSVKEIGCQPEAEFGPR